MKEDKKKDFILSLSKYLIYFILYSFIGWFYEVFLEVVVYRWGYTDRGVLCGPYCPVYGVGTFIFLLTVYPLIKNSISSLLSFNPSLFLAIISKIFNFLSLYKMSNK